MPNQTPEEWMLPREFDVTAIVRGPSGEGTAHVHQVVVPAADAEEATRFVERVLTDERFTVIGVNAREIATPDDVAVPRDVLPRGD